MILLSLSFASCNPPQRILPGPLGTDTFTLITNNIGGKPPEQTVKAASTAYTVASKVLSLLVRVTCTGFVILLVVASISLDLESPLSLAYVLTCTIACELQVVCGEHWWHGLEGVCDYLWDAVYGDEQPPAAARNLAASAPPRPNPPARHLRRPFPTTLQIRSVDQTRRHRRCLQEVHRSRAPVRSDCPLERHLVPPARARSAVHLRYAQLEKQLFLPRDRSSSSSTAASMRTRGRGAAAASSAQCSNSTLRPP